MKINQKKFFLKQFYWKTSVKTIFKKTIFLEKQFFSKNNIFPKRQYLKKIFLLSQRNHFILGQKLENLWMNNGKLNKKWILCLINKGLQFNGLVKCFSAQVLKSFWFFSRIQKLLNKNDWGVWIAGGLLSSMASTLQLRHSTSLWWVMIHFFFNLF